MNKQRIAIITDSGTDTDEDFRKEHDIRIMPLRIIYSDGSTFSSGIDISSDEVVRRFGEEIPTTSLPSPHEMRKVLEQARDDGYTKAVVVTIASALSATNQTARMVADEMEGFPVLVVDSKSIGIAAGMVVRRAVEYVEADVPFEQLEERLAQSVERTDVFFAVKSLEYLYKGGRINSAIYRLGSILNIKPILTCSKEGYYTIAKKVRGWGKALDTIVGVVAEKANGFDRVRLALCCTKATSKVRSLLETRLRSQVRAEILEFLSSSLPPDLIVHTGPELVGMGVQGA